jgi:uncharacterized protein YecE (DUF72 family)
MSVACPASENVHVLRIGTSGWNVPVALSDQFRTGGSHLERYATRLNCVEINSSFYRPHQQKTYARWANATPATFRFAVKIPRVISHAGNLQFNPDDLARFASEVEGLGAKLGVLLVQFPPSLAFEPGATGVFFKTLQHHSKVPAVCEPRHASWFTADVDAWMEQHQIARVAADPARAPGAGDPGGWRRIAYFRLHGSPRIYYSGYEETTLTSVASKLENIRKVAPVWCMFDNTASGAAMDNAVRLARRQSGD